MSTWNMPPGVTTADIPGNEPRGLIATTYCGPPLPTRMYDWVAHINGEEHGPTGHGPTECEALRDLCEQLTTLWMEM